MRAISFRLSGIRFRLLIYAAGVALPLGLVGFFSIRAMFDSNRRQLDESIRMQAEIVAVAFDQWLDIQRESLATLAAFYNEQPRSAADLRNILLLSVKNRAHWAGIRVLSPAGKTIISEPQDVPNLSNEVARDLLVQVQRNEWAVEADWSEGAREGIILLAVPTAAGGAVIAQVEVAAISGTFLKEVKLPDQSVLSVLGPHNRILIYRNPRGEDYLGMDMSDSRFYSALAGQSTAVIEMQSRIDRVTRVYGLARAGATGCIVLVGLTSDMLYAPARNQLNRFIALSLAGLLLAIAAAALIARGIAKPLRSLSRTALRFGAGDLDARADIDSSGEIGRLRDSFNSMASQIAEREARLTELDRLKSDFVSGVSHEMRTPLTTVKTLTRVLRRGKVSDAEREEFLDTIAAECDRQIDLVLNLLDLSRIEAGTFNISLAPVDIADLLTSVVEIELHNSAAHHHELDAQVPESLPRVLADYKTLRRVLCGLVENAIKYTPDSGRIRLSARAEEGSVRIDVSDTGCGIREEDIARIFDKFYRGRPPSDLDGNSSNGQGELAETGGVGLGLYLARTIIEEIGGTITVQSRVGRGSVFTIRLPVWNTHSSADRVKE
jgi:signal transduction histidine kinase